MWNEGRGLTEKTRHYDLAPGHSAETPRIRRISS
ncbi:phytanoyl-CoA dioxygenase family protein, partial [Azospirillum brasilense]